MPGRSYVESAVSKRERHRAPEEETVATDTARQHRKDRIRKKVEGTPERPRLTVFRSAKHIYAQVIDDTKGSTLVSVSTLTKTLRTDAGEKAKTDAAKLIGAEVAKVCKSKGIAKVVFDRNGFLYHGRIKALADAAREAGLDF
jgi:large subunit ribosomal protein L18